MTGSGGGLNGGGIYDSAYFGNITVNIGNTILAGNISGGVGGNESEYNNNGDGGHTNAFVSNGYNLYGQNGSGGGFTPAAHDILLTGDISTVLAPLANNGGPTQTMALIANSPAIAAGSPASDYEIDQRGLARPLSGQVSIGAYEYNPIGNPFIITSTADQSGLALGTLRTALDYANNNPGFNPTITTDFTSPQTITLSNGQLLITSNLTLDGGPYGLTLDANNNSRVMEVDGSATGISVTLNKLTFENGNGSGANDSGDGGGLLIYSESYGGLTNQVNMTINNSTFANNTASFGGGIYFDTYVSTVGNNALTLNNDTITENSANSGGGIHSNPYYGNGMLYVNNSTISKNTVTGSGGGIYDQVLGGTGGIIMTDSILAGNNAGYFYDYDGGTNDNVISGGHNIYGQNGDDGNVVWHNNTTDILLNGNINTVLASLADNGGPTQTMALINGSIAINAGGINKGYELDQRGYARNTSGQISIGAYEYNAIDPFVVTSTADQSGLVLGTLRTAIDYANHFGGDPTITTNFSTPQTITLDGTELLITSSLTLDGGIHGLTLNANNTSRVMEIDGNTNGINVTLDRLTIENGNGSGLHQSGSYGGGLLIYNEGHNQSTVTINNSTFLNNSDAYGGGLMADSENFGNTTTIINNSTFVGNSAGYGGAIYNDGETLNATMTINNSTITGNTASGAAGIENDGTSGGTATLTITNSIISGNLDGGAEDDYTSTGGTLISGGHNLYGQNSNPGTFIPDGTTDILLTGNINTVLAPLADNGGPTKTMALVASSAAIGAGAAQSEFAVDQRGDFRPLTGGSIGAYEYNPANPYLITSTADTGTPAIGTLRTAIDYANHFNSDPTITTNFTTPQTITLDGNQLVIGSSLTLDGGTHGLTIDANHNSRVMEIDGTSDGDTVNLNHLTLENGNGAGINVTGIGGGLLIYAENNNQANVTLNNSTITNNSSGSGGGLLNDGSGGLAILNINNSTISNNSANSSQSGGGIFNLGTMVITNSTIANNHADGYGGGIFSQSGQTNAELTISNSTISGNTANGPGGGIGNYVYNGISSTVTINDSIVAGNSTTTGESDFVEITGATGTLTSNGYNLYGQNGNAGGFTPAAHDILLTGNINTVISALANNGGPTETMALVNSSPAIAAGGTGSEFLTDQRGEFRSLTGQISIGAYEVNTVNPYLITSATDTGTPAIGTLRTAIDYANHFNSDPTITTNFTTPQTITLDGSQLLITSSLTLDGGTHGLTIDANHNSRVMEIDGSTSGVTVNLSNLTLENGNGSGINVSSAAGNLLVYAQGGNSAVVSIDNSTISNGSVNSNGGDIYNDGENGGSVTMTINNSTVTGGSSSGGGYTAGGGGIYNDGSNSGYVNLTINNSTVSNNTSIGGTGAGIDNNGEGGNAVLTITNSNISGNASDTHGGGIFNDGSAGGSATLTISNSTMSGNSAGNAAVADGGAIFNFGNAGSADVTINNSTLTGNSASRGGGAVANNGITTLTVGHSILAGNTANGSEVEYTDNGGGTFTSNGYNLYGQNGSAGGFVPAAHDILLTGNISTVLSALANNGGPTETMALVTGSLAIAAGGSNTGYELDQRGDARSISGQISIGAYEYNAVNPYVVTSTADQAGQVFGTLRTALDYANHFGGDPTITTNFTTPQTITLDGTQLLITSSLNIDGGAHGLTIDANNNSRVMEIDGSTGGITVNLNRLTLENGNDTNGGGIYINDVSGKLANINISNSAIINNTVGGYGGAIYNDSDSSNSMLTINNTTITGNSANLGGAIFNNGEYTDAELAISNSTISGNTASTAGGGIFDFVGGNITIGNTILAGNTVSSSESDFYNNSSTLTSNGYNLYGQSSNDGGFTPAAHDILLTGTISTVLSSLADNGGPVQTMALKVGSVALDAGDPAAIGDYDARGMLRGDTASGTGSASDIGAYEAAVISVTADDKEINSGQSLPALTYTITGGPTGHLSGSLALITNETNVGTYAGDIGQGSLAADKLYILNFTAGQLKIDAASSPPPPPPPPPPPTDGSTTLPSTVLHTITNPPTFKPVPTLYFDDDSGNYYIILSSTVSFSGITYLDSEVSPDQELIKIDPALQALL